MAPPPDHLAADALDTGLRRSDPDRWLSSRFIADPAQRADVACLYAFDAELALALAGAREPLAAEIRLTWWAEAVDDLFAGKPARGHPVLEALTLAMERRGLAREPLAAMVEARFLELDGPRFESVEALDAWIDGSAGALTGLVLTVLGAVEATVARPAARAWALTGLVRQRDHAGVDRLPAGWDADQAARQALAEVRGGAGDLPVEAFPAVAHLSLAPAYLGGANPLGLVKRMRLTWAVLTGRV